MSSPVVITGVLRADAEHRRTTGQISLLSFELHAPSLDDSPRPVVLRVVQPYGSGEAAAYAARARAARLRRGVRVTVHAGGLHRHPRGALVLQHVQRIDEPDLVVRPVAGADQ